MQLHESATRQAASVAVLRPFLQFRVIRSYGVSPPEGPRIALRFILFDPETSNFNYEIANRQELVVALALGQQPPKQSVEAFVREADQDVDLVRRLHLDLRTRYGRHCQFQSGRRLGWYAAARRFKPRTVIEELAGRTVELFVHDSLHACEHEPFELEVIHAHSAPKGVAAVSDNAHAATALADFAAQLDTAFVRFNEQPVDHFYPGSALGIAAPPARGR